MKEELGNCYINDAKNIKSFSFSKIKRLTGFGIDNETFVYICNSIVTYINDSVFYSDDFEKPKWNEYTKNYLKEDALDFYNDELNNVVDFEEKEARRFVHEFPKIVENLIKAKILIFEK